MIFPSKLIEDAVNEFSRLPGVGRKTALRLVLHLLKKENTDVEQFALTLTKMRSEIKFCTLCHNVADTELCNICSNTARNKKVICVVENLRDVIAIESTQQFNGLYHILGGIISPLDGIGPDQLTIEKLVRRIEEKHTEEIIMALSPNIEGDTTIYYINKKIAHLPVQITTIARGVAFGGELEYTDEMTLARSIEKRLPVERFVTS